MDCPPNPDDAPPYGGNFPTFFPPEEDPPGIGFWLARHSEAIETLRQQQESSFSKLHDLLDKRLDARRTRVRLDDGRPRDLLDLQDSFSPISSRMCSPRPSQHDIAELAARLDIASSPGRAPQRSPQARCSASCPVSASLAQKLPKFKASRPMPIQTQHTNPGLTADNSPGEADLSTASAPAELMLAPMSKQVSKVAAYLSKSPRSRKSTPSAQEPLSPRLQADTPPPPIRRTESLKSTVTLVRGSQNDFANAESAWPLTRFVRSSSFDNVCAVCLTLNAAFIGIQVQYQFEDSTPVGITVVDYFFCICFIAELAVRLACLGAPRYFWGFDWHWNWFDFTVVSCSTIDAALNLILWNTTSPLRSLSVIRVVRIVRLTRVLRIIRALSFFKPLRLLVSAIVSTMKIAIWAGLLLCIVMYMFGIAISQCVAEYIHDASTLEDFDYSFELYRYFGSVPKSIFTILMSVLGGVSWEIVVDPLANVGWFAVGLFVTVIAFLMLCVMNVLVGIFCENAIETSKNDKENLIQVQLQEKQRYVRELQNIFSKWSSCSEKGGIIFEEFQLHMDDPYVQALFKSMEIESHDAWTLFMLLDRDGEGTVDLEEFIDGCIRLRGTAKALHLSQVEYSHRWLMNQTADILACMRAIDALLRLPSNNENGALREAASEASARRTLEISAEEPAGVTHISM